MKKKVLYLAGFVGGLLASAAGVVMTVSSVKKIKARDEEVEDDTEEGDEA